MVEGSIWLQNHKTFFLSHLVSELVRFYLVNSSHQHGPEKAQPTIQCSAQARATSVSDPAKGASLALTGAGMKLDHALMQAAALL